MRYKINRKNLIAMKEATGLNHKQIREALGFHFHTLIQQFPSSTTLTEGRCYQISELFNCRIEDFTDGASVDGRTLGNNVKSRMKKKDDKPLIPSSWQETLPNGVIFIHAPFMETWQSSMKPSEQPNCIYHRDSLGMKRKIIEKQKNATIMYLDDWKPIEDIREAFRELREIL